MYKISIPIQIRFSDIDMFQHVNNTIYPAYIELARLEYFREHVAIDLKTESSFTVNFEINYKKSATFKDKIEVLIRTEKIGNSSLLMDYSIVNRDDNSIVFATGKVKQVHMNPSTGKVIRVSDDVRNKIMLLEDLPKSRAYPEVLNQ